MTDLTPAMKNWIVQSANLRQQYGIRPGGALPNGVPTSRVVQSSPTPPARSTAPSTPMPEPQGNRTPANPLDAKTYTLSDDPAAKKALDDAIAAGNIQPRALPFADVPAGTVMPGGNPGATGIPADIVKTITGGIPPTNRIPIPGLAGDGTAPLPPSAPMPNPPLPTFINGQADYWKLTPQQREQAVKEWVNYRPGTMPTYQIVDNGWLNSATSPTQMTDPRDTRLALDKFKLLTRDEQIALMEGRGTGEAAGQYVWAGPKNGYVYQANDYSDMIGALKEYGRQPNYSDKYGADVANNFSPQLLNSLAEATKGGDAKAAFIEANLKNYMADPGSVAYQTPAGVRFQGSDPVSALSATYEWQKEVADKKAAKKAGNPRNRIGSVEDAPAPSTPVQYQPAIQENTGGGNIMQGYSNIPYFAMGTGSYDPYNVATGFYRPGQEQPYINYNNPPPQGQTGYGTVGGWGDPPTGGWGTDRNGNPILGTMPGQQQFPRPKPLPLPPYNPMLPGGSQGQRPNAMPVDPYTSGGFAPERPGQSTPVPVPSPGNVPGGGQVYNTGTPYQGPYGTTNNMAPMASTTGGGVGYSPSPYFRQRSRYARFR